jgi:precorrin-6B methylase 2
MRAREAAGQVPDELMATVRGYQESRIVLTAVELDLFSRTRSAATASHVADALGTDRRATEILLDALAAMGLLTKADAAYENSVLASRYLAEGAVHDARLALRHNLDLWTTWSTLTDVVRSGKSIRAQGGGPSDTEAFIGAMHKNAALRAPLVVRAVGLENVRRMIDIGGGSGAYAIAFAREKADLRATILDVPAVLSLTQRYVAEASLSDRVTTVAGDLRADGFGRDYDLALLSAICHMLGPDENQDLFRRVFAALAPGGRVVIQDHIMRDNKTAPKAGAIFAVNMLVGTPRGSSFSEAEYMAWLSAVGFVDVRHAALAGPNDLVVARRPTAAV